MHTSEQSQCSKHAEQDSRHGFTKAAIIFGRLGFKGSRSLPNIELRVTRRVIAAGRFVIKFGQSLLAVTL
jgi:hypothetical protein